MSLMSIWLEVRRSLIQSWFFSLTGHWTLAGLLYISGYHFPLIKERKNQNRWFCKVFASRAGVTQPPVRHTLEHFINALNMPGPSSLLFCQDQNRLMVLSRWGHCVGIVLKPLQGILMSTQHWKPWAISQTFASEDTDSGEVICSRSHSFQAAKPERELWLSRCKTPSILCGTRAPGTLSAAWCYFQSVGCSFWKYVWLPHRSQVSGADTLVSLGSWGRGIFPTVPRRKY